MAEDKTIVTASDPRAVQLVGNDAGLELPGGAVGQISSNITTSYARVEVVKPGGVCLAPVERLAGHPHIETLAHHV